MKTDCRMAPLAVLDSAFKRRPTGLFRQHGVRLSAARAVLAVLAVSACLAARPAAAQVPPSATGRLLQRLMSGVLTLASVNTRSSG